MQHLRPIGAGGDRVLQPRGFGGVVQAELLTLVDLPVGMGAHDVGFGQAQVVVGQCTAERVLADPSAQADVL